MFLGSSGKRSGLPSSRSSSGQRQCRTKEPSKRSERAQIAAAPAAVTILTISSVFAFVRESGDFKEHGLPGDFVILSPHKNMGKAAVVFKCLLGHAEGFKLGKQHHGKAAVEEVQVTTLAQRP